MADVLASLAMSDKERFALLARLNGSTVPKTKHVRVYIPRLSDHEFHTSILVDDDQSDNATDFINFTYRYPVGAYSSCQQRQPFMIDNSMKLGWTVVFTKDLWNKLKKEEFSVVFEDLYNQQHPPIENKSTEQSTVMARIECLEEIVSDLINKRTDTIDIKSPMSDKEWAIEFAKREAEAEAVSDGVVLFYNISTHHFHKRTKLMVKKYKFSDKLQLCGANEDELKKYVDIIVAMRNTDDVTCE